MNSNLRKPFHIFPIFILLLWGCSAQKNTGLSRAYHNLTAKYNVLFNGTESYKDGLAKIDGQFQDNYSEVLPVFNYKSKSAVNIAGSDMDRTIKKSSKLITLHSITAKPKVKDNKTLSPDERAFFSKKEYNMFVDDAYLLMAKAHFYRHEYALASDVLRKIINDFKTESTVYEARIWLARLGIETGQNLEVADILTTLLNDDAFPDKLKTDLYVTFADYYLTMKNYPDAISYLEKATETVKKKKIRTRYLYILAQLYEKTGDLKKASSYYESVLKSNPPYEMAFNARINRALAYERGFGKAAEIETELLKMIKDDKNLEYQDQIYYALGNLATKEGDEKKAVGYYEKSLEANKGNEQQRVRSYLTLANYYYSIPDYPKAQAFYDSVITHVGPDYPGYNNLFTKSKSLTRLVTELNTISLGDSVHKLASLPKDELYSIIDGIIEAERKKQEEQRLLEQEKRMDEQFGMETALRNSRQSQPGAGSNQWYFYNDAARNMGYKEFKAKWGNRRLEDHWQRSSKAIVSFAAGSEEEGAAEISEQAGASGNNMSRDFYLAGIPATDSAAKAILVDIEEALYNSGLIYKDELKDFEKANDSFRKLISRFPGSQYELSAYYNLYILSRDQNNPAMTEFYKNQIAVKYPESMYARILTDPDYFEKIKREEQAVIDYYNQTYQMYLSGNFSEVVNRSKIASVTYPGNTLAPRFRYLGILAAGKSLDRKIFRDSLVLIIASYPGSEIADDARNLVSYMDKDHPEFREAEEIRISQELYRYIPGAKHHFIFALNKRINANQLVFNIINYNLDHNDSLNLIVEVINLSNTHNLVSVKTFRNQVQVTSYLKNILAADEIRKDIPDFNAIPFVISDRNLVTLRQDKSVDRYLKFYNENYK